MLTQPWRSAYEDGVGQCHEDHPEVELEAGCEVFPPPGKGKEREDFTCVKSHGWLVVDLHPSEKYESTGMMTFTIYGKIKFMFETTNQYLFEVRKH